MNMKTVLVTLAFLCIYTISYTHGSAQANFFPFCSPSDLIYRSFDGKCNNIMNKNWGSTLSFYKNGPEGREAYPWQDIPEPAFEDLPTYAELDQLPSDGPRGNSRLVSAKLSYRNDTEVIDPINHSMFSVMFGQFLNHDFENNHLVDTHQIDDLPLVTYVVDPQDPTCLPNPVPPNNHGYRCNPNDTVITIDARFSKRVLQSDGTYKVYNNATGYVDLDTVYGRSDELNGKIRSHTHGKILMRDNAEVSIKNPIFQNIVTRTFNNVLPHFGMTGLPVNLRDILPPATLEHTFTAGDERVNENIALTFFQTLFAREHNKICDELINQNFLWKLFPQIFDDVIFHKARAINIAKYQHVVYEQFFPTAIGPHFADVLGTYQGYKPNVDATTLQVFSGAAFRYGHFSIRNYFALDECGQAYSYGTVAPNQNTKMTFIGMSNPTPDFLTPLGLLALSGGWENIARGLVNERAAPIAMPTLHEIHTFSLGQQGLLDLISLDIARQRHNNLPNYQVLRKFYHGLDPVTNNLYGLPGCPAALENQPSNDDPIECFEHITGETQVAGDLKSLYRKVNLIDGVVGFTVEKKVAGTSFSRTNGNVMALQFKNSRDGDRFFYRGVLDKGFLHQEKLEILSTTMGGLVARNFDVEIPENPFEAPDNYRQNLIDSCEA